jgi:hypothetical protein
MTDADALHLGVKHKERLRRDALRPKLSTRSKAQEVVERQESSSNQQD